MTGARSVHWGEAFGKNFLRNGITTRRHMDYQQGWGDRLRQPAHGCDTGTTPAEMTGQSSFAFVFPEDLPAAQRLFDKKRKGDVEPFRFKLRRKDGSSIAVTVQGTPMFGPEGEFHGVLGTFAVQTGASPAAGGQST